MTLLLTWLALKVYHRRWIDSQPDERGFARIIEDLDRKLIESRLNQPMSAPRHAPDNAEIELKNNRVNTGTVERHNTVSDLDDDEGPRDWA